MKNRLLALLLAFLPLVNWGQGEDDGVEAEPYVVMDMNDISATMTFYYDDKMASHQATMPLLENGAVVPWANFIGMITSVVFDKSFANYTSLTSTANWFAYCEKLTSITGLENLKTDGVKDMSSMFEGCSNLITIDMSGFKTDNVADMHSMFLGCSGLTTIYAGSDWTTAAVTNGRGMFSDCKKLVGGKGTTYSPNRVDATYARIDGGPNSQTPGYFTAKISEPYAVLSDNNTVLTFYYDGNKADRNGMDLDYALWYNQRESITTVVFDDSFANCLTLTSTVFWFDGCSKLTTIIGIENLKTDNVTEMFGMFYRCPSLTNLDVSGFKTDNVTNMGLMFCGCSSLSSLDVSHFNTENVTDMFSMFSGCSGLSSLDVSSFKTDNVTDMSDMFSSCDNLETIYSGTDWSTSAVKSGNNVFSSCTKLVGGKGTTYDYDHNDYAYARIDGGPNSQTPGYFTDKNAVNPPTFRFDGDYLVMETTTENASIFYQMADLPSMDDATVEKISKGLTVTADVDQSNLYEQPIELKKSVVLKAIAVGAAESEPATLVYDYDAWYKLFEAIQLGNDILEYAVDKNIVPSDMIDSLIMVVSQGQEAYDNRAVLNSSAAEHATQRIFEFADQVEKYLKNSESEPYAVLSDNNTVLTFYYDGNKADLNGMDVVSTNAYLPWLNQRENITKVVFDDSFANCLTLTSTAYWFEGCSKLTTIIGIEKLKTDNVTNMNSMFAGCSSLTSLDVSGFKTDNVRNMVAMFSGCFGLSSLDASHFNTENVTNMLGMFGNCSNLTSLDVSGFNTQNVTDMANMFYNCSGLTSLDLSSFNTSKVVYDEKDYKYGIARMFAYCSKLSRIYVSESWTTANLTESADVFLECPNLVGGKGTTYDYNHIDYTYARIDGGPDSQTPGYFTDKNAPIPYAVLSDNGSTVTFYYDNQKMQRNGMEMGADDEQGVKLYASATKAVFDPSFANYTTLTSTSAWFYGCEKLTEISGLQYVNTSKVTNMASMFQRCSSLQAVDVSKFDTRNVENMDNMFDYCSSLTSLDLSNFNTAKVKTMGYMFVNCHNLTSLNLSSFDTRNVKSMRGMFSVCRSLTNLDLSSFNTESLETTNEMFYYCSSLGSLDLSSFNTKNVSDMFIMFYYCQSLKTIFVSDQWTTASVTEGDRMFYGCFSLVGGKGTQFNAMNEDYTYAHIDEGPSNPGYLTRIGDEPYEMSWVDQLANGDAEKPWVNPNTRYDDLQNNYKICAWSKEKGVNMNNDGGWDPFPATIEEEKGNTSNHVFVVHGKTADTAGDASAWDNQFWIESPQAWSVGTPIWIKFRYKASKNVVASTQVHKQTPSDYLHYEGIGDISFTTEWQQFNGIMSVKSDMDGFWSIAFNLNSNDKSAIDFYFDDLSWSVYQEIKEPEAPTFRFDGENLVIASETANTKIFYQMADLPSMDDATVERISSGLTVTADAQQSILYEKPIELKKSVVLKAIAVGATESEVSTLVYDYNAWQELLAAVWRGEEVRYQAQDNAKVPSELTERLAIALDNGMALYSERAVKDRNEAIELTHLIMELCEEIERLMNFVDATFDSHGVLAVGSGTTMTDALEYVGGRAEVAKTITAIVWNNETALTNGDLQGLDNPNMLIYVADASLVPANRNNVVIGDLAKNIVLTDVSEGNGNFYCPKVFKAQKISYSHEYNQKTEIGVARGWESIALPFRVQTITHEKNGVIAPFGNSDSSKHFWLRQLSEDGLMRATVIEPNTAYLISMPNNEVYPAASNLNGRVTFSSEDMYVPVTEVRGMEIRTTNGDMVVLLPSFHSQATDATTYALNVGEERDGYPEGSIFLPNYRQIRTFEAYTIHHGNGPAPQYIPVFDLNGSNTTGIEDVRSMMPEGKDDLWYDMSGRKLQGKPAKKGVYIRDGKKIVVE
jgi:surface protein